MEEILEVTDLSFLEELSVEELRDSLVSLKKLLNKDQKTIDENNQQIYAMRRELAAQKLLESDYVQEIELLRSRDISECKKLTLKLQACEEQIISIREEYQADIQQFERDLKQQAEENKELQTKLSNVKTCSSNGELDQVLIENLALKKEFEKLAAEFREADEINNKFREKCVNSDKNLQELRSDYESLQEVHRSTQENARTSAAQVETLEEELLLLRQELEEINRKPVEPLESDSRGNSLFAEVNDKRVYLQDKMSRMTKQYESMRKQRSQMVRELSELQTQNIKLSTQWNVELEKMQEEESRMRESLEDRIKLLEEKVDHCDKELTSERKLNYEKLKNHHDLGISTVAMLSFRDKQIKDGIEKLDLLSLNKIILNRDLREAQMEVRKWSCESIRLTNKCKQLEGRLEENNGDVNTKTTEICKNCQGNSKSSQLPNTKPLRDFLKKFPQQRGFNEVKEEKLFCENSNKVEQCEETDELCEEESKENKERCIKMVTFAESTIEPAVPDRKFRRGKIIECKTKFNFNLKKK